MVIHIQRHMGTTLQERKYSDRLHKAGENGSEGRIRSFFPEELANEMGFEGMRGKHADFRYSYTYKETKSQRKN